MNPVNSERRHVPLTVNITAVFLVIAMALAFGLTSYSYQKNSEAAIHSAESLMEQIASLTGERFTALYHPTITLAEQATTLSTLALKPVSANHPTTDFLLSGIEQDPQIHSAYIGWSDGEFFQVLNLDEEHTLERATIEAPEDTHYAFRHIYERRGSWRELWRFFNGEGDEILRRLDPSGDFDPRARPWYRLATQRGSLVATPTYIFDSLRKSGFTVAKPFDGGVSGVFGVDLTTDVISRFLRSTEETLGAQVSIFTLDGKILAHSDESRIIQERLVGNEVVLIPTLAKDLNEPVLNTLIERLQTDNMRTQINHKYTVGETEYISIVNGLGSDMGEERYISVTMPVDLLVAPILETRRKTLLFTFIALTFTIPLIVFASWRISSPLRKLVVESERIRALDLDREVTVSSRITEVFKLAESIRLTKHSLRSFGYYVPKGLVTRLINSGVEPQLGGQRRELTVMFTDIKEFTPISEHLDAQQLMVQLSDYFEVIGREISETQGTIDKFFGDGLMAFWNAPEINPDHVSDACLAALNCRDHAKGTAFTLTGEKHSINTRIGLHTGQAVVGNMGSRDRMDYSALGATVNLASRLESLNKYYRTQILVTDEVVRHADARFRFRSIDRVRPKGIEGSVKIYELIGFHSDAEIGGLRLTPAESAYLAEWENAMSLLRDKDWIKARQAFATLSSKNPQDKTAEFMVQRCINFEHSPPPENWDGVTHFDKK